MSKHKEGLWFREIVETLDNNSPELAAKMLIGRTVIFPECFVGIAKYIIALRKRIEELEARTK